MDTFFLSIIATLFVGSISLIGVLILIKKLWENHSLITTLVSFAAGALLGDVFLHLMPEHIEMYGYETKSIIFILVGITAMLIIESYFHCSHDSSHELAEHHHKKTLARINILGDALHNFLDGMAIATSFLISPAVGLTTTLAVILHEIPQELADTGILVYSGWRRRRILAVNFLTGLTAVLGVIIVYLLSEVVENIEAVLIPLAIGQFIYIALADLLPEIHKKSGVIKYLVEILMFILGILIMAGLKLVG